MSSQDATVRFRLIDDMRRHWAVYLGLLLAFVIWCAVDVMPRARLIPDQPSLHMTDFTVYTEAAKAMWSGQDPYEITNVRGWPYIYPPLFALLISPLALLSEPWQAAGWFSISLLCLLGSYYECWRLLDMVRPAEATDPQSERLFMGLAFAAAAMPTLNCLQRGQVGVFLLYPLLIGLRLSLSERSVVRWILGGLALMLPVAVKLTPALPVACLGFMLMTQAIVRKYFRPRFAWVSTGVFAGAVLYLLLIPSLVVGWNRNLEYLAKFNDNVGSKVNDVRTDDFGGNVTSKRNQSLSNAAYRFGNWSLARLGLGPDDLLAENTGVEMPMEHPIVNATLLMIRIAAVVALLVCSAVAALRRDQLAILAAFGLALTATFIVSPVARGHYFLLWIPGILFLSLWLSRYGRDAAARRYAYWAVGLCVVHYLFLNQAGRIGVLGLGTTIWFFAGCRSLYESAMNESILSTYDSPQVRAIFVESTLRGERKLKQRRQNAPEVLRPPTNDSPGESSIPQSFRPENRDGLPSDSR